METEALVQGTEEWFAARRGKLTASRVHDAMAKTKAGWGASRKNIMAELVAERLTGTTQPSFTNAAMQHGIDTEPQARAAYEFFVGADVVEVGMTNHPRIAMSAASPDGLVGDEGMLEIKAPMTATHIETLLTKTIPGKYITQMMWQLACAERQWCDYVSFDPRMPEHLKMFVKRVERDDERIAELETLVQDFLAELDEKVDELNALPGAPSEPLTMAG